MFDRPPKLSLSVARGGGAGNMTRGSPPFHSLLRDLHPELQRAVHRSVARFQPRVAPRVYYSDWEEELYHEAALAAWIASTTYDPNRGCSLYQWGIRVITQHLKRYCDKIWLTTRHECEHPCDEETGELVEFEDTSASEAIEVRLLMSAVGEILQSLPERDKQVANLYLLEGYTEAQIAAVVDTTQQAVSKRLKRIVAQIREALGVEQ
jgi:RNA polymerase sigma factor (sigma-70 family)